MFLTLWRVCMIPILACFFAIAVPSLAAVEAADTARVITIDGEINSSQVTLVERGLKEAAANQDKAVVVSINTLGGAVDSALKIRDMLQQSTVPTIAFIPSRAWSAGALIALSCRHIIMAPGSSVGAAEPIPNTEKNVAALKAEFSATAQQHGYNPRIAEAMVDKTVGFPHYADVGTILALSDTQAKELNISSGTADSPEEALRFYSLGDATVYYTQQDWRDSIVGILQNPYVRVVFIALIIAAVLAEIKMGGIGIGLLTAIVLGAVLLMSGDGSFSGDLKVIAAFIGSIILIGLELVTPGVGIFGVSGVIMLFASLFYMLGASTEGIYILAGGTVLACILFYFIGKHLPKSKLLSRIALHNRSTKEKGYTSQVDQSKYLYQRGTTITILRPAGTIRIGKDRVDAVSNGSFIDRDVEVRVVQVEGSRVVVEPVPNHPS